MNSKRVEIANEIEGSYAEKAEERRGKILYAVGRFGCHN